MRIWLAALLLMAATGCSRQVAQGRADGAAIYAMTCARCHGVNGIPEPAMAATLGVRDLTDPAWQARFTDEAMRVQIINGSPDRRMPAFQGALTEAQLNAVIQYIRTLAR